MEPVRPAGVPLSREAGARAGHRQLLASQRYEGDWGALFAALAIAMLPVVVVYLIFYRQIQAGLTSGTLK